MYLTGVDVADCAFIYDIETSKSTLFIPPIDPESVIWSGLPLSPEEALAKYDVDEVLPTTELNPILARLGAANSKSTVFAIADRVADNVTFLEFDNKDFAILAEAIDECRVVKDDYEIALIKKANQISAEAHKAVLESVRKAKNEYELEGVFTGVCSRQGAKKQAYPSIVASGRAAATLHYVHNNKDLAGKDLLLLDAGAEWETYASDIVRRHFEATFLRHLRIGMLTCYADQDIPHIRPLHRTVASHLRNRTRDAEQMHRYAQRRRLVGRRPCAGA